MTSPLLVFCLGPSRVPFLHPADWVLSSQPAQSAVPVPLSVPLWVPAVFPTGPSGADLLVHPTVTVPPVPWDKSRLSHGPSPSSTRPVLSWGPFALLGYFSVPSSSCFPHLSPGPLAHPQSLSEFTPLPAVPIPILVFSFSATPLGVPSYSPFRSPGALAEPLATPLPGCSRPLRRDSGCHSGARALTSVLSPAAPAPPPPLTCAPSRSRAGSSRAGYPRAASARESPSRPTLHAGP